MQVCIGCTNYISVLGGSFINLAPAAVFKVRAKVEVEDGASLSPKVKQIDVTIFYDHMGGGNRVFLWVFFTKLNLVFVPVVSPFVFKMVYSVNIYIQLI